MILREILVSSWVVLREASLYIIFGLLVGGLLKMFITPSAVAAHLGRGRVRSVLKAALIGIPLPLCSCGVLPAAVSLKKQGASNGATMAFLISTPESGVDSISISWALLDPIMTIVRPIAAFVSAFTAGVVENFRVGSQAHPKMRADLSCPVDNCCDGIDCSPEAHRNHHTLPDKLWRGIRYAATDLWGDMAGSFFVGVLLAGIISVIIPENFFAAYLGGGLHSMLIMLVVGIPLYICATASTPIAAAFILKGVSPGAALVFLLVGPATNTLSISVLTRLLGKRATGVYLLSIAIVSVVFGLGLDQLYAFSGLSARVTIGTVTEIIPLWLKNGSAAVLFILSLPLFIHSWRRVVSRNSKGCGCAEESICVGHNTSEPLKSSTEAKHRHADGHNHGICEASKHKDCC